MLSNIKQKLAQPVDAINLIIFRICFGLIMLYQMLDYVKIGFAKELICAPKLNFTFTGLDFVKRASPNMMQGLVYICIICCIFITIGRFYKIASALFFVVYTYFFLVEKSLYNNHIYLICNLLLVITFLHLNAKTKITEGKKSINSTVPFWQLFVLQFFIVLTYFYGGLAKINPDWFAGEPVRTWLKGTGIDMLMSEPSVFLFTWSGIIFDLVIGFLFYIKKTRKVAFTLAILFNINNAILFDDISIFPFFMIAALLLFAEPTWIRKNLSFANNLNDTLTDKYVKPSFKNMPILFYVLIIFHLIFPLRHYLYSGRTDWTGKAQFFTWHMKSQNRKVEMLQLFFHNPIKKEKIAVPMQDFLIFEQWATMGYHPEMMVQFAHYLKKDLKKAGFEDAIITADCRISMNNRPVQYVVDTNLNLASINLSIFEPNSWVLPLKEK